MTAPPIVMLDGVTVTLPAASGPVEILRGIDLSVARGESLAVVGPSGSGKSTLLMVLAGLERPTAGRVTIAGKDLTAMSEDGRAEFRRTAIGIVFQSFHLIPTMSALENVAVPMELAGRRDAFEAAQERLGVVGLGHRHHHYPAQLSGGEQQRVALARALAVDPPLILADEPTGNLDGHTGAHIADMLFDLHAKSGTTLILITHDLELAARCDRIARIRDGLIVDEDEADGVSLRPAAAQ